MRWSSWVKVWVLCSLGGFLAGSGHEMWGLLLLAAGGMFCVTGAVTMYALTQTAKRPWLSGGRRR
jgi:membrane protein DedA with SNARE-associated domain